MKKFNTAILIASVFMTMASLTACSAGNGAAIDTGSDEINTSTDAQLPMVDALPIDAYPAVGEMHGVVADLNDPSILFCDVGFETVSIGYLDSVEYNGTIIKFTDESYTPDDFNEGLGISQRSATITFSGAPLDVVGMIVKSSDGYRYDGEERTWYDPDLMVNVTPEMLEAGIILRPFDFVGMMNIIAGVDLCVAP